MSPSSQPISILTPEVKVKASSGSSKHAKSLLTSHLDTAWTSEPGQANIDATTVQSTLTLTLPPAADQGQGQGQGLGQAKGWKAGQLHSLSLTAAGGFVPLSLHLLLPSPPTDGDGSGGVPAWREVAKPLYPEDSNAEQTFLLDLSPLSQDEVDQPLSSLQIALKGSTDEYGRVTLYALQLFGLPSSSS